MHLRLLCDSGMKGCFRASQGDVRRWGNEGWRRKQSPPEITGGQLRLSCETRRRRKGSVVRAAGFRDSGCCSQRCWVHPPSLTPTLCPAAPGLQSPCPLSPIPSCHCQTDLVTSFSGSLLPKASVQSPLILGTAHFFFSFSFQFY